MSLIPQAFIDDLLDRTDIVEVIDSRVKLKKAGKNYLACCPFHKEKSPSFSVSPDKQFYYCFGCGASGTAITFLLQYEHLGFIDAVESLARGDAVLTLAGSVAVRHVATTRVEPVISYHAALMQKSLLDRSDGWR